jgi:hypothetical protein
MIMRYLVIVAVLFLSSFERLRRLYHDWISGFRLCKVFLIEQEGTKHDVTTTYKAGLIKWEPSVYVEYRYTFRGRKFRMITYKPVEFPPYKPKDIPWNLAPHTIVALVDGSEDVSRRLQKYEGPHADFYIGVPGAVVTVSPIYMMSRQKLNTLLNKNISTLDKYGCLTHATLEYDHSNNF